MSYGNNAPSCDPLMNDYSQSEIVNFKNVQAFFCFSLFEITEISLGCTKMENFYREKAHFTPGENWEK